MDIKQNSRSCIHTPCLLSQQLLPFHINNCGHFYAGGKYYTEREGLDSYLLLYSLSGSGLIKYREREFVIQPLQAFFIHCQEYQYYRTGPEDAWEFLWFHFNGPSCKCYFELINGDGFNIIDLSEPSRITGQFNEILSLSSDSNITADIRSSSAMTDILSKMAIKRLSPSHNASLAHYDKMINSTISYIQSRYNQKINISDLTKMVHISEYHFLRIFKKYTGISPYEYITNYRINKSKTLLGETSLSINEIAFEVGFNNINNYIRSFKKLVGTTPMNYRNYWTG